MLAFNISNSPVKCSKSVTKPSISLFSESLFLKLLSSSFSRAISIPKSSLTPSKSVFILKIESSTDEMLPISSLRALKLFSKRSFSSSKSSKTSSFFKLSISSLRPSKSFKSSNLLSSKIVSKPSKSTSKDERRSKIDPLNLLNSASSLVLSSSFKVFSLSSRSSSLNFSNSASKDSLSTFCKAITSSLDIMLALISSTKPSKSTPKPL